MSCPPGCDGNSAIGTMLSERDADEAADQQHRELMGEVVRIVCAQKPEDIRHALLSRLFTAKYALQSALMCAPHGGNTATDIRKALDQVTGLLAILGVTE
jgi:hypothetical protein